MKRGVRFLLLTDAWATLALGMIGPIYAIFVEKIGGDILEASWAYFAFMISSGVALYVFGKLEDKIKNKQWFLTGGYAIISLGCLSYLFVENQTMLILTQILLGLGSAILSPVFDSLYSQFVEKKHAASEWGDWEAMGYVVTAIAALLGGYIATKFGFKTLFGTMFMLSLISVLVSLTLHKDSRYLSKE